MQRSFDPIIAEAQIRRLDDLLAQQSLMREVDLRRIAGLETELSRVLEARNVLAKGMSDMGELHKEVSHWREVAATAEAALHDVQEECVALRAAEAELVQRITLLRKQGVVADDERTTAMRRAQEREEQRLRVERLFVEMDETAARQDLFIEDMFFRPLRVALDAAIVFETEANELRAAEALRAVEVPIPPNSSGGTWMNQSTASSTTSQQQQEALIVRGELEAMRQQNIFLHSQVQRLERLVEGERNRNETMMVEHTRHLERVQDVIASDRRQFSEKLASEVNSAFREGMLRERAARKAKREAKLLLTQQQSSTSKDSHNTTTTTTTAGSVSSNLAQLDTSTAPLSSVAVNGATTDNGHFENPPTPEHDLE